ncbi:MAG: TonB-dependent receptor [Chlorobi bacterium]|nr:TonB-dependent receptor [Chlorobiota bacterium]
MKLTLLAATVFAAAALAQQQKQPSGEPIDFMTIVIEGKEALNLPKSLVKVLPQTPKPYNPSELDSINPLEKVPLFRSVPADYPRSIVAKDRRRMVAEASAGLYGFATVAGQFQTHVGHYTLDARGTLDRGGAYTPNADYFRSRFEIIGRYASLVHDSTTQAISAGHVQFDRSSYRLFARPDAPARSLRMIALELHQQDVFDHYPYSVNATIRSTRLSQADTITTDETDLRCDLRFNAAHIGQAEIGGFASLSYRNYRTVPLHFHTIGARARHIDSSLELSAAIAGQFATTSWRATNAAPMLEISARWSVESAFWIEGTLDSRLDPVRFGELSLLCPYIADTAAIGVRRISYRMRGTATYQPRENMLVAFQIGLASYGDAPILESVPDGTVGVIYRAQIERTLGVRARYTTDAGDGLSATIEVTHVTMENSARQVPYRPLLSASLEYARRFTERFTTSVQAGYVSSRLTTRAANERLSSYFLLGMRAEYQLNQTLAIVATADNLFGSAYERWQGYRERGSFVAVGAVLNF